MVQTKKTDNSHFETKVQLRIDHLPEKKEITVLDAYAGKELIWKTIAERVDKKISVLPIEKKAKDDFHLPGDNMGYLATLDLSLFDIVDLDAYGVPYEQMNVLFERDYRGIVFVTFIRSVFGQMNYDLLIDIGFSERMVKTIPTLFGQKGWQYFCEWLAYKEIRKIHHRSRERKHYIYYNMRGLP